MPVIGRRSWALVLIPQGFDRGGASLTAPQRVLQLPE